VPFSRNLLESFQNTAISYSQRTQNFVINHSILAIHSEMISHALCDLSDNEEFAIILDETFSEANLKHIQDFLFEGAVSLDVADRESSLQSFTSDLIAVS